MAKTTVTYVKGNGKPKAFPGDAHYGKVFRDALAYAGAYPGAEIDGNDPENVPWLANVAEAAKTAIDDLDATDLVMIERLAHCLAASPRDADLVRRAAVYRQERFARDYPELAGMAA